MSCYIKDKELVSIIIPVYNVVEYFDECIRSVLEQTYKNLEIILIDDGSNDGSEKMCNFFAEKDNRIIVFHQENSGQAVARNRGVSLCKGNYIAFVDSDDVLDKHYIEFLYKALIDTNSDMSVCYYKKFYNKYPMKNQALKVNDYKLYNDEEALEELCYQRIFNSSPYVKLLRRELVIGIDYPPGIGYEDFATIYKYMARTKKIVVIDNVLYFYRQRENSTMHMKFSRKKIDRILVSNELLCFIKEKYPKLERAAIARMFLSNLQVVMDLPFAKEYQTEWLTVKKNIAYSRKNVLSNTKVKTTIRIMAACSYMGMVPLKILGVSYNVLINRILKW